MVSLLVDTAAFLEAGDRARVVARSTEHALSRVTTALSASSHMAGSDRNGRHWAGEYDRAAARVLACGTQLQDAAAGLADRLTITGALYDIAETANAGDVVDLVLPAPTAAASTSPAPSAAGGKPWFPHPHPGGEWIMAQIQDLIGDAWPDGDTDKLDAASHAWHRLADDFDDVATALGGVAEPLGGLQSPELHAAHEAVHRVRTASRQLADASRSLGKAASDLSGKIRYVHTQTEITLGIAVAAMIVTAAVALGLTPFTFGISDLVGGGGVMGEIAATVATVMGYIAELASTISAMVAGITTSALGLVGISADLAASVGVVVGDVTASTVLWGTAGAAENTIVTSMTEPDENLGEAAAEGFIEWGVPAGAATGIGGVVRLAGGGRGPGVEMDPSWVKFSQESVSYKMKDPITKAPYTYDDLVRWMREGGWKGKPIDIVDLGDNGLVSVDNRRLRAARESGINVRVVVHHPDELLPNRKTRERFSNKDSGLEARTWGDAVYFRIQGQKDGWGLVNPHGSHELPTLLGAPQ